ncbi:ubiquitin fusion degradation protein UFD1 family protein [Cavenderia fasciculata]|uniref:Ubiquitin fusion degradation protein UFD1 family protein n=1 Tax=Cavenderia fasciculata TaxID=261658 RepID=F4PK16_CACFS|nr:ubiquitin fusion degradation protein UFD1 family protein [Cavenderia fasciculata]EGG23940.1 ubiquitin fusion degradation protein UFD1 family protein [Cavenderia fasciculata]|eukprot:XP_004361791.1 ubiquitin fusion degradation protein UFD1 family protein [Cavenderia fasciculata]
MSMNEFMFGHVQAPAGRFNQKFNVLSMNISGKSGLEAGGKILLPPSALNTLSRLNIQYPMLFEISNQQKHRSSHCGIQEFSAEEGVCYMPKWMMENLHLKDNDIVDIKSTSLPSGQFVKIQPHSSSFLDISNPKAVLENALRKFATLTKSEDFVIEYNKNKYYLKVVEIKPHNPSNAISIIETDISVDFAPPLDSKEATQPSGGSTPQASGNGSGGITFGSQPIGIGGNDKKKKTGDDSDSDESDSDDDEPKFKAFGGAGTRLDGKVGTPPKSMMGTSPKPSSSPSTTSTSTTSSSSSSGKFAAFQGKGRSLKD